MPFKSPSFRDYGKGPALYVPAPVSIAVPRAIAKVSTSSASTSAGSFGTLPAAGSTVIVMISTWNNGTVQVTGVSDNQGNGAYTQAADSGIVGTCASEIWYKHNIGAPSGTFTVTCTAATAVYWEWVAIEAAGVLTSDPIDKTSTNTGVTAETAGDPGTTATTTVANEVVCTVIAVQSDADSNINLTDPPTGYTSLGVNQNGTTTIGFEAGYKIVSATAGMTAAWTFDSAAAWGAAIATFKGA